MRFKALEFREEQAEVRAEPPAQIIEEKLTTKKDLKEVEIKLEGRIVYCFSPTWTELGLERCWLNAAIEDDRFIGGGGKMYERS